MTHGNGTIGKVLFNTQSVKAFSQKKNLKKSMTHKVTAIFFILFASYLGFSNYLAQIYFQRLLYAMGKSIKSLHCTSSFLCLTSYKLEISWCSQSRLYVSVLENGKASRSLQSRSGVDVWVMIRTVDLSLSFCCTQGWFLVDRGPSWQGSILSFSLRLQGSCSSLYNFQKGFRKPTVKVKSKL